MNQAIVRLFLFVCVLFALLVAWTSRWTVFEQEDLEANTLNKRQVLEEQRIPRGAIRASDGTALARSVKNRDGTYTRRYPLGEVFAQPVGYSFLTVGRAGLEQSHNAELVGEENGVESVVDQLTGKEQRGNELRTTLDPDAQKAALAALQGRKGAVVALEPSTGRVRVMASSPSFDPNALRDAKNTDTFKDGSAVNRVTSGQYPPGSTFKVVTAVAAIDSGKYTKDSQLSGKSPKTISGTPLSNFNNEQFGSIPLTTALTNSVNTVWAQVGVDVGRETMQDYMERFGFYERVPVDLPEGERGRSGVLVRGRERFVPVTDDAVDLGRVAIGQGGLLATPLQMAQVASAVANDGTLMKPTLTDRIVDRDGRTVDEIEPETEAEVMKSSTAREVGDMMANVVREGTGTAAALSGVSVAGKTGTAEIDIARGINTPWFIGFAPRENPRYAVAVAIERAQGQGGVVAAPIAKQVLEELLK
jgi:peptidoglycan glycosyltransferase